MPRSKRITRIFAAFWKTAEAAIGAQGREIPETPRQDLVYIGLMANIPDNFVTGNRKDTVQGIILRKRGVVKIPMMRA